MDLPRVGRTRAVPGEFSGVIGDAAHFNPNHDDRGQFSSGEGGGLGRSTPSTPGEFPHALRMHDGAVIHSDTHYDALSKAFAQGYKPADIAAVGDVRSGRFCERTDVQARLHFKVEIREAWSDYQEWADSGFSLDNFNPNHDDSGEFASGPGGESGGRRSVHVERGIASAQETIRHYANHPGPVRGGGEMRQTEAGMRAWKSTLEAAGYVATYQRGSGFTRIGQPGAARGTGLAMYSIELRRP